MCSTLLIWFGALLLPIYSQPTDLFTGFFPCVPDTNSIHTQEDAQSCDLFVYAAVQLALNKIISSGEVDENGTWLGVLSLEMGNSETIMDVSSLHVCLNFPLLVMSVIHDIYRKFKVPQEIVYGSLWL